LTEVKSVEICGQEGRGVEEGGKEEKEKGM
jgi:hypothetical protein